MKTLEQLKKQVAVPKAEQAIPSEKKLRENEEVYESICIGHDARITVYRNGYVVCMIGRHKTVFPISAAGYYTFGENDRDIKWLQKTGADGMVLRGKLRAAETAAYFRRYSLPDCACGHQTAHNHYDERRASVTC